MIWTSAQLEKENMESQVEPQVMEFFPEPSFSAITRVARPKWYGLISVLCLNKTARRTNHYVIGIEPNG